MDADAVASQGQLHCERRRPDGGTQRGEELEELLECVARCGVDKYKGVSPMPPAAAVRGFVQNLLGKANEEEVVKQYAVDHHL